MRQPTGERKQDEGASGNEQPADEVTMVVARDLLGDIVNRARLMGTRTVLTRNGRRVAAIIPIAEYERLKASAA